MTLPATCVLRSLADPAFVAPAFPLFVIYERPKDWPESFVCRVWDGKSGTPTGFAMLASTLEAIRAKLPRGCVRLDRAPGDDPVIVETWI